MSRMKRTNEHQSIVNGPHENGRVGILIRRGLFKFYVEDEPMLIGYISTP